MTEDLHMDRDHQHLMDGRTILYTYSGGLRFEVHFAEGKVSYQVIGDSGSVNSQNSDIPYQSRQIRPNLIHTVWHETSIGDIVSLVIDLDAMRIYSAALLGYRDDDPMLHFEDGVIEKMSSAD